MERAHPHPSRRYGCLRFELMVGRPASSTVRLTMQASGVGVGVKRAQPHQPSLEAMPHRQPFTSAFWVPRGSTGRVAAGLG